MKTKFLLFAILFCTSIRSFSQQKITADMGIMSFLGRIPQKIQSNSLSDNLLRMLYYDIQPKNYPKIGYLNKKGEVIIAAKYNMGTDFYDGYANIIRDSIYGYVDKNGTEVLIKNYEEVFFYYGDTGIAKKNGKYGLINRKGESLTEFSYTMIGNFGFDFYKGQTPEKKAHILDKHGNIVFNKDLKFDIKSHYLESDSLFIYQETIDGKNLNGLVNTKGQIVMQPKYQDIYFINDKQLYAIKNGNKYGFIDKLGNEIIPPIYDKINFNIHENLIPVSKNKKWGFVNRKNEEIIPFIYDEANAFLQGLAVVKKGDFYGCIDTRNITKVKFEFEKTDFPFFTQALALFKKNGKYGFIDKKGTVKIPAIYDNAFPFVNGLACVELNGKVGYVDKKGKEVIEIKYKQLWFESDGVIRFAD